MNPDGPIKSPAAEHAYSWTVQLRYPSAEERLTGRLNMTASEEMFFEGAPLAHVVQYEEHLRIRRASRRLWGRARRPVFSGDEQLTHRLPVVPDTR